MKKSTWLLIISIAFLSWQNLFSFSGMEMSYSTPALSFKETKYTKYRIRNTNSNKIENVSVTIIDDAGFDITLYNDKNIFILPKEEFNVGLELYCNEKVFFEKNRYISVRIQYGDQHIIEKERVKITPPSYLWPLFGTLLGIIFSLVLLLLFKNYTKEDKND